MYIVLGHYEHEGYSEPLAVCKTLRGAKRRVTHFRKLRGAERYNEYSEYGAFVVFRGRKKVYATDYAEGWIE